MPETAPTNLDFELPPAFERRQRPKLGPADFELLARATEHFGPLTNREAAIVIGATAGTVSRLRRDGVLPPGRVDRKRNAPTPSRMALGRFRLGVGTSTPSAPAPHSENQRWPRCAECGEHVQSLAEHWQTQHVADAL